MKKLYLSALSLACLHSSSPAFGQLLPTTDLITDQVTQQVETYVDQTVEQTVEQNVEQTVEQTVAQTVQQTVEQVQQQAVDQAIVAQTAAAAEAALSQALTESASGLQKIVPAAILETVMPSIEVQTQLAQTLPRELAINNRAGKTVFNDVAVENGWRAVQNEWLLMLEADELRELQTAPVDIVETQVFAELALTLVRFRVAPGLDSLAQLKKHLPADWLKRLDRHHIYAPQAKTDAAAPATHTRPVCEDEVRIGMIDTAIQIDHPAFASARAAQHLVQRNFLGQDLVEPDLHGSAVAGLLVGQSEVLTPLLPQARLYSASVFFARAQGSQGAPVMNLIRALNWLLAEKVDVINMSLSGPDNIVLAKAIHQALRKHVLIVAAVGNAGPAAPPLYPAAYPGVIGATAVDHQHQIYRWANQGEQVYFSAPGIGIVTVRSHRGYGSETGTSMAAPTITAFLACEQVQTSDSKQTLTRLIGRATDLGKPGKDAIFGYGLLASIRRP